MPFFKVDLLLKQGQQGASEVYYVTADSVEDMGSLFAQLYPTRLAFMPPAAIVQGLRWVELDNRGLPTGGGDSINKEPNNLAGTEAANPNTHGVALFTDSRDATDKKRKHQWLRFTADSLVNKNANANFDPTLIANVFTNYSNVIKNGRFFVRHFDTNTTSNLDWSAIMEVSLDQDGYVTVLLEEPFISPNFSGRIKVKGYKGTLGKGINGLADVLGVSNNKVILNKKHCSEKSVTTPGGGARAWQEKYDFAVITKCYLIGDTTHDTGRAFFARRGRRSKIKKCQYTPAVVV